MVSQLPWGRDRSFEILRDARDVGEEGGESLKGRLVQGETELLDEKAGLPSRRRSRSAPPVVPPADKIKHKESVTQIEMSEKEFDNLHAEWEMLLSELAQAVADKDLSLKSVLTGRLRDIFGFGSDPSDPEYPRSFQEDEELLSRFREALVKLVPDIRTEILEALICGNNTGTNTCPSEENTSDDILMLLSQLPGAEVLSQFDSDRSAVSSGSSWYTISDSDSEAPLGTFEGIRYPLRELSQWPLPPDPEAHISAYRRYDTEEWFSYMAMVAQEGQMLPAGDTMAREPQCPFPSEVSFSEAGAYPGSDSVGSGFALTVGKENIKPTAQRITAEGPSARRKMQSALQNPAVVHALAERDSSMLSGESEREMPEPKWEFHCYGEVLESEAYISQPLSRRQAVQAWVDNVERQLGKLSVADSLSPPPIVPDPEWDPMDWENLGDPSETNFMKTPTPSEYVPAPMSPETQQQYNDYVRRGYHPARAAVILSRKEGPSDASYLFPDPEMLPAYTPGEPPEKPFFLGKDGELVQAKEMWGGSEDSRIVGKSGGHCDPLVFTSSPSDDTVASGVKAESGPKSEEADPEPSNREDKPASLSSSQEAAALLAIEEEARARRQLMRERLEVAAAQGRGAGLAAGFARQSELGTRAEGLMGDKVDAGDLAKQADYEPFLRVMDIPEDEKAALAKAFSDSFWAAFEEVFDRKVFAEEVKRDLIERGFQDVVDELDFDNFGKAEMPAFEPIRKVVDSSKPRFWLGGPPPEPAPPKRSPPPSHHW